MCAVFDAYGIKEAEVTKGGGLFRSNAAGGIEALRDGKIDVFINGGFLPTAEIADIARGRPLLWISGDPAKIKAAADRWCNDTLTVPKGVYPFVAEDETTIALWNAVACRRARAGGDGLQVHQGAWRENEDRVRSIHPSLGAVRDRHASFAQSDAALLPSGRRALLPRGRVAEVVRSSPPPPRRSPGRVSAPQWPRLARTPTTAWSSRLSETQAGAPGRTRSARWWPRSPSSPSSSIGWFALLRHGHAAASGPLLPAAAAPDLASSPRPRMPRIERLGRDRLCARGRILCRRALVRRQRAALRQLGHRLLRSCRPATSSPGRRCSCCASSCAGARSASD